MRRLVLIVALLFSTAALAQEPDLEALINGIFAEDLTTVTRYLPPQVEAGLNKLKREQREALKEYFVLSEMAKSEHFRMERPDDGKTFIRLIHEKENEQIDVILIGREYGRDQSILTFKLLLPRESPVEGTVTLRYDFPEWRVYEGKIANDLKISFDEPEFVERAFKALLDENESRATTTLYHYRNALHVYADAYPDVALPFSLTQLGPPPTGDEPSREHLGELTEEETSYPYTSRGYRFEYRRLGDDRYSITARPKKFGVTGIASYYTDESGIIRSTEKDEPATADTPLEPPTTDQ